MLYQKSWMSATDKEKYFPIFEADQYLDETVAKSGSLNFVMIDCYSEGYPDQHLEQVFTKLKEDKTAVICLSSTNK